jgi:hypothetical protein
MNIGESESDAQIIIERTKHWHTRQIFTAIQA